MISRFQAGITLSLALVMLVILVSPAVPSAPTTLLARHSLAPVLLALSVPVMPLSVARSWQPLRELLAISHAPDVVDLTSARLC